MTEGYQECIFLYSSPNDGKNEVCERKTRERGDSMSINPELFKNETIPTILHKIYRPAYKFIELTIL